jgi:hypothetical protein
VDKRNRKLNHLSNDVKKRIGMGWGNGDAMMTSRDGNFNSRKMLSDF